MELPADLYHRLADQDLSLLPLPDKSASKTPQASEDRLQVPKSNIIQLESGFIAAQYLFKIAQNGLLDGSAELDVKALGSQQVKPSNNPTQKLHNWNIIIKELQKLEVTVEPDEKSLLVAGDPDSIVSILLRIYQIELEMSLARDSGGGGLATIDERGSSQKLLSLDGDEAGKGQLEMSGIPESPSKLSIFKEVKPEQPISILQLRADQQLDQTKTTLEFVIVSLCQAIQISPSQAAGLLTDHNYYLMHACIKGIKGDHSPILKWYQLLCNNSSHLIDLALEGLPTPDEDEATPLNDSQINDEDIQPLFVMLSALKCGLFSERMQVCQQAFRLFYQIASDLNQYGYQKVFAKWFLQQPDSENARLGGGLEATLYMLGKHSYMVESASMLIVQCFKGSLQMLVPELQESGCKGNKAKLYLTLAELLPYLHQILKEETLLKLITENSLIEELIRNCETNNLADVPTKSASISLLVEIWSLEPLFISENQRTINGLSVLDSCLKVLKNTCKFGSKGLKLSTLGQMFRLLDQFALSRDNQAPVIYKLLIFALIENIEDQDIRQYCLQGFTAVFQSHKTIPVSILAEPLLRMLQMNDQRLVLNVTDFTFFEMLARHPKLTPAPQGLLMLDQFAKLLLQQPLWSSSSSKLFFLVADRFAHTDQDFQDFIFKLCSLALGQVQDLAPPQLKRRQRNQSPMQKSSPKGSQSGKSSSKVSVKSLKAKKADLGASTSGNVERDTERKIKLALIVQVVDRVLHMRMEPIAGKYGAGLPINDQIRDVVLKANRKFDKAYGQYSKALMHLLEFWHQTDAKKVMDEYSRALDEIEKPQADLEDIKTILNQEARSHIHEEDHRNIANLETEEEYFRILGSDETRNSEISSEARDRINNQSHLGSGLRQHSHQGSRLLVPYVPQPNSLVTTNQIPKPPLSKRVNYIAGQHIDAIKNRRDEKQVRLQLEDERKKLTLERNVKKAKEQLAKRRIELGIVKGAQENDHQIAIYEPHETLLQDDHATPKRHSMPAHSLLNKGNGEAANLRLIDLENEEEERERDGVKILLTKYNKLFKFLFNKYALSGSQHQRIEKFEYYGDKQISVAEICKMLKDHELLNSLSQSNILSQIVNDELSGISYHKISKDQIASLLRLMNQKSQKKHDTTLSFSQFIDMLPQVAFVMFSRANPHLSLPEMLQQFLKQAERATKARGQSTILFEDPDVTTMGDQEILKELNRRVRDQPECILPEGYYKVVEKEQVFKYGLPPYIASGLGEARSIAIETLDTLLSEKFGFHFLEAIVTYESRYKVRPRIKHSATGSSQSKQIDQQQQSAVNLMNALDKKPFNRDLSQMKNIQSVQSIQAASPIRGGQINLTPVLALENQRMILPKGDDTFPKPKLGVNLKLALIEKSKGQDPLTQAVLQDTASVLEELLLAVESGHPGPNLPQRLPKKEELKNAVNLEKEERARQEKQALKEKEELRKKRHAKLQEEIEKKKQEQVKQEEERKAKREEEEKDKKVKERRDKTVERQKVDAKRLMLEEARKKRDEEKLAKVREEEERKLKDKATRQKGHKDFFKKQKEQLESEFQKRRQDQQEAEKAMKEMEELKRQQQEKVKSKMVNFMRQNKDQARNEQAEWLEISSYLDNDEVQEAFNRHSKSFGLLFKHYAVMDKKDMQGNEKMRINLNEFTKFGFQTKLSPLAVSLEDMTFIFRSIIRERTATLTEKDKDELGLGVNSLGIEDFKKALIRIAILGQSRLSEGEYIEDKLVEWQSSAAASNGAHGVATAASRQPRNIRIRNRSVMNSAGSQRRGIQRQPSSSKVQQEKQEEAVEGKRGSLPVKRTKEQKVLEELAKAKERQEKMGLVKIEDRRLTKGFDVGLIRPGTMQAMINFLQLKLNQGVADGPSQINAREEELKEGNYEEQEAAEADYQDGEGGEAIEAVGEEELQENGDEQQYENIVGPDGENENWHLAE